MHGFDHHARTGESVTDPGLNARYDSGGNENAHKCFRNFARLFAAPNGAGNVTLGVLDCLQRNWVNASDGYRIGLFASPNPDSSLSVSPSSQSVAPAGTTSPYTVTPTLSSGFAGTVNPHKQ
jgi:hypothetical protein